MTSPIDIDNESAPAEAEAPDLQELGGALEALLFASTEPLTLEELRVALPAVASTTLEAALDALDRALDRDGRGVKLEKVAGGWRLVTRPEFAAALRTLFRFRNQKRLTPAALDVLAIVAYAQPVTAPEIQEIRGTDPSYALRTLIERQLVRMVGRKRVVGRPILYGTTRDFLLHFGLDSLEDLPPVEGFDTHVGAAQGKLFAPGEFEPLGDGHVDLDAELPAPAPEEQALAPEEQALAPEENAPAPEAERSAAGEETDAHPHAPSNPDARADEDVDAATAAGGPAGDADAAGPRAGEQ